MPWTSPSLLQQREEFVRLARLATCPFRELCRDFEISPKTGYKWLRRYEAQGRAGLSDHSRRPSKARSPEAACWPRRVAALRRKHPSWGAKKLRVLLAEKHGPRGLPSVRSMERWLKQKGLLRPWRRTRRGPAVPHPGLTSAQRVHQVWTVDFKGWYRTRDGVRQEPLTVRDLCTRFVVAVCLLPDQSDAEVRRAFRRIFRAHGLPEAIRVDNGSPFGGKGALGLSRLSVWWTRLGIRVEFTRRARPGDNAGHEQMHAVYQRDVAKEPSANRQTEQRRAEAWRRRYNAQRPHEALALRRPAEEYRRSQRRFAAKRAVLVYDAAWPTRRVHPHGDIKWQGRLRFVGRAFVGETVGLQLTQPGCWDVYLGELLIGELRAADPASMRPAQWQRAANGTTHRNETVGSV